MRKSKTLKKGKEKGLIKQREMQKENGQAIQLETDRQVNRRRDRQRQKIKNK